MVEYSFGFGVSRTAVSDADFQILAGGDNVIDGGEFRHIFQAEMEANRIYTGTMDENSMQSDEAIAYGAATEIAGAPTHMVAEFNRLEGENASLREQLKRVKEEQSRMMHLMLVYGKMLGTYDGPVHSVQALAEPLAPLRMRIKETASTAGGHHHIATLFDDEGGDEFTAIKPWKGAIHAPSSIPPTDTSPPDASLELEWAYGYASQRRSCRGNVAYSSEGKVVYHTASLGVILNGSTQRFHQGHTDDIVSFAMDPKGRFVATGQMGKKPSVHMGSRHRIAS